MVTADHGEAFLEHGDRYHSPTSLPEHLIHVPLLLRARWIVRAAFVQKPFSLIHLAPTLLDAVGVSTPNSFQGRSGWGRFWPESCRENRRLRSALMGVTIQPRRMTASAHG